MKKIIKQVLYCVLIIGLASCKGCSEKEKEKFLTNTNTPSTQIKLTLGDGFFGDCSMIKTGTNDSFKIKVKIRGISGYDGSGIPITYVYKSYVWPNVSNNNSSYDQNIEIPNTGGFFLDVSLESNSCVKCCTIPTTCATNFGYIELFASRLFNGTVTVSSPILMPASLFTKICY